MMSERISVGTRVVVQGYIPSDLLDESSENAIEGAVAGLTETPDGSVYYIVIMSGGQILAPIGYDYPAILAHESTVSVLDQPEVHEIREG